MKDYEVCPLKLTSCIYDPGFIKTKYPEEYKRFWGDKEPKEVVKNAYCQICGRDFI